MHAILSAISLSAQPFRQDLLPAQHIRSNVTLLKGRGACLPSLPPGSALRGALSPLATLKELVASGW